MKYITPYIIIIILSVVCFLSIKSCVKQKSDKKEFIYNYNNLKDSANYLRDKNNILHSQNINLQLSKEQSEIFYGNQIDSMADLLKIKPKQIKSIVYVPFKAEIDIDSLKGTLSKDTLKIHSLDTIERNIRLDGLMSLTKYEKGTGFLNLKKKHFLDVHFNNPIFTPLNISGFDITTKPKRFGIGPYVGYGFIPELNKSSWSVGISIHYDLIRF